MSKASVAVKEASALPEKVQNVWHVAEREMRERPWRTVALAAGAGYVVGGGLFSPFTARLLGLGVRVGLRAGAVPLLASSVSGWAEDLINGNEGGEDEGGGRARGGRRRASS